MQSQKTPSNFGKNAIKAIKGNKSYLFKIELMGGHIMSMYPTVMKPILALYNPYISARSPAKIAGKIISS